MAAPAVPEGAVEGKGRTECPECPGWTQAELDEAAAGLREMLDDAPPLSPEGPTPEEWEEGRLSPAEWAEFEAENKERTP